MEKTKLTVWVPRDLLDGAKRYADQHNTTLTRLASEFLRQLGTQGDLLADAPVVRGLSGTLSPDASIDDCRKYLEEKYERFRLGTRVVELGLGALRGLDLRQAAFPYMQQLVERFGETCDLGIFDRGMVLYIEVVHNKQLLTIAARVGRRLPAYCTASGRVFLAFLPPELVEPVLREPPRPCTERTTTTLVRLQEELEATRQRGYALDDEESEQGIRAVSVPVWDIDGNVIAALSMPSPIHRMPTERMSEIADALLEAADAISAHVLRA
jgi:DNA-binding IclR family transcriptional regulator